MSLYIPPQTTFFYKDRWTPDLDASLLETITRLKHEHNLEGTVIPKPFFHIAVSDMAYDLGVEMPWDALYDRLHFLESRYLAFTALLNEPEINRKMSANYIDAPDALWTSIFEKNKLAAAYYYIGEPLYDELCTMFGPKPTPQPQPNVVVVLTDSPVPAVPTEIVVLSGRAGTDETVVSLFWPNEMKSRRKLFGEEISNADQEISTDGTEFYYAVQPKKKKVKAKAVGPKLDVRRHPPIPNASRGGSVCGSSNSVAWWKVLKK